MSILAQRPEHIPDALVYDFDMYHDAALVENAPARILDIASNAPPVFWTPHNGGHWIITTFRAAAKAARDWESFSSNSAKYARKAVSAGAPAPKASHDGGESQALTAVPIQLDPPEHAKYRAPLNSVFSPKAMMALQDKIRNRAAELIESIRVRGRCEFMTEIAEPLPVEIFLELFGLPLDRLHEFHDLVVNHLSQNADHNDGQRWLRSIADAMNETLLDRRVNPRNDIISLLWQTTVEGKPLTLHDMENYCVLLFIAGLDTVMNAMGHGVGHLARNPGLQEKLRANPKLIPEAGEELLRCYSVVQASRMVARDLVFEGVTLKQGERIWLWYLAADVDEKEFPQAEIVDLGRENKAHIAFGAGPHRCLGSHLARIELQTLYEEMLARLPPFRLDPNKPVRYRGGPVVGPKAVHLVWDN
ncbi:MAG: cytochrome P450 [Burkholderiales bacterium]